MMCSHAQIHTAVVNLFQLNSHFSQIIVKILDNIRIPVKTYMYVQDFKSHVTQKHISPEV